jgi:hypothetical protein
VVAHLMVNTFCREKKKERGSSSNMRAFGGRLHVSDSANELPYDSEHNLHSLGLGF